MKINNKYLIKTPDGYKDFIGIRRSKNTGLVIHLSNGNKIECTKGHRILVGKNSSGKIYRRADRIKVGSKIKKLIVTKITTNSNEVYYYDPVEISGQHNYVSSEVTHHNCLVVDEVAFIRPHVWDEFADSIFPSQSGLAWKKNILISTANGLNHFHTIVQGARNKTNGYINYEVSWEDVPRYNSKGELKTPDEFREEIIAKYGIIYFEQNYGCVVGNTRINIYDTYTNTYKEVTCEELEELIRRE